jgi:hypothetical protein
LRGRSNEALTRVLPGNDASGLRRVPSSAGKEGRVATFHPEHEELLNELLERLRAEGAPQGMWLVEISQAREQLQSIDALLRRLTAAIIASLGGPDVPG